MTSLRFAHGTGVEELYAARDVEPVARAFLPDRLHLPTGELAPAVGRVVPGMLFRTETEAAAAGLVAETDPAPSVVLIADGGAQRARVCHRGASGERSGPAAAHAGVFPRGVFVYGTLRSGEERHSRMQRPGLRRSLPAAVPGTLLDLGEYPGLVSAHSRGDRVIGELFEYEDPRELLAELDEVEDFFGYDSERSLYRRSLVEVPTPEGQTLAWVYVYVGDISGARLLLEGDWKRRR